MNKLRILTARPHRLLKPVLEDLRRLRGEKVLLLVPEHMTVSMEEMILREWDITCLMGIDVLSPTKLYNNLVHHHGQDEREPLSSMGYRMVISRSLENMEDKLRYYRRASRHPGVVAKLAAFITDMKRGGLTPSSLREVADTTEDALLKAKYQDLADIFEKYQSILGDRFYDSEDRTGYMALCMRETDYLRDKILYIYGFDTLTEQLSVLIEGAAEVCRQVVVAMVCDAYSPADGTLYAPIQESLKRLIRKLGGINQVDRIHLPPEELPSPPDIACLDHMPVHAAPTPYAGEVESIRVIQAVHPYEEATIISRQVLGCVQEGISLTKMAVLFPDDTNNRYALSAALSDAGIPFFDNRPLKALNHPLVQFLLHALRSIENGWSNDNMLPLLETGFSPLNFEEACLLTDYALSCGIQRKLWEAPFTRGNAEDAEPLRQRLMEPLLLCRASLLEAQDACSSLRAVYTLLEDIGAVQGLTEETQHLTELGLLQRADQNRQLWDALMDLMDETLRLEDESRIPLRHIADRFENALSAVSLKALPPSGEVLQIGTLDHMIIQEADVVFLMGLNEGILCRETESLLRPEERLEAQKKSGCYLGLTDMDRNLLSELDLRKAMTLPKQRLYLSYSENSENGSPKEPLGLLLRMNEKVFGGKLPILHGAEGLPLSDYQAEMILCRTREEPSGAEMQELAEKLRGNTRDRMLGSVLRYSAEPVSIGHQEAVSLFGEKHLTISRLESFANCPFMHFVEYGLRPRENRLWKIDPRLTGDFCHRGMDLFGKNAIRTPGYPRVNEATIAQLTEESLRPLVEELKDQLLRDGARNEAILERCCEQVRSSAKNMTRQLADGNYTIWKTEVEFGYGTGLPPIVLCLPDGREVALRGRIDRVDRGRSEKEAALRVVDLKSSDKELVAGKISFGLQLQLLLYLNVCSKAYPGLKPAGAFYFHIYDPFTENGDDATEKIESELRKAFCMKGVRIKELEYLDGNIKELPYKQTIPVTEEQMRVLLKKTEVVAAVLAERLLDGDTSIDPASFGDSKACDYCKANLICKKNLQSPMAEYHEVEKIEMQDFLQENQLQP